MKNKIRICVAQQPLDLTLDGFNPQALNQIYKFFGGKNITINDLVRAYLHCVQEKSELESKLQDMIEKIPKIPSVS